MTTLVLTIRSLRHSEAITEATLPSPRTLSSRSFDTQPSRSPPIPETSAPCKTTMSTYHSDLCIQLHNDNISLISAFRYTAWSSSMFITWNTLQPEQLWTEAGFSACSPNTKAPIIAVVIINQHVQIMRLRGSTWRWPIKRVSKSPIFCFIWFQILSYPVA